jgi:hypothetical protein
MVTYLRWADSEADIEEDEPLRRETFDDPTSALASTLIVDDETEPDAMSLALTGDLLELESLLHGAGLSEFALTINSRAYGFDGEHLLDAAFARERSLALAESALRVVWSFHAGMESSASWVSEVYEAIGETEGVFFYIDRHGEDGTATKLGRMPEADAISKGLAMSPRTNAERAELLEEDDSL